MYKVIQVYKGTKLADKVAILPNQVRKKIELMMVKGDHLSISGACVILAELFGVLLGLRRSEHFATAERKPNRTTLLCFRNLVGTGWDLGDCSKQHKIADWASKLTTKGSLQKKKCASHVRSGQKNDHREGGCGKQWLCPQKSENAHFCLLLV